jgi:Uma2 family endonuclease
MLFSMYELRTPGTQFGDNATVKLGNESEPQPDLFLRILPEFGGQSTTDRQDYVVGPPELIAEVAQSSRAIDLHAKRDDYARNGVTEYLVMSLADRRFFWFDLPASRELPLPQDGVIRLRCFPGFWIDVNALFNADGERLISTLQQGIASDEHTRFVSQLASVRKTA